MNYVITARNNLTQAYNRFDEFTCELAQGCMGRQASKVISRRERNLAIAIKCVFAVALVFGALAVMAHPIAFGIAVATGAFLFREGTLARFKAVLERNPKTAVVLIALSFTSAVALGLVVGQSLKPCLAHQVTRF